MERPALFPRCTLACVVALLTATAQAQIPDEFTNLELLDSDISKGELIDTMRGWTLGLGVRCNHCHVGPDNLVGMDFASDEKLTKQTARRMLVMARTINGELLADLPISEAGLPTSEAGLPISKNGAGHQAVSCYSCHRGQREPPRDIVLMLSGIAAADGLDAALERYDELRAEHYGAGVYDFSEQTLSRLAGASMQAGHPEDAVRVLEKNLEHYPESAGIHAMIGFVHLQTGDPAAARTALERALEIDPENQMAGQAMQMLEASPPAE